MKLKDFSPSLGYVISNNAGTVIDIVNGLYYICGLYEGEHSYSPLIPFTPTKEELESDNWYLMSRFLS